MISIRNNEANRVVATVGGEFSLDDFRELENAIGHALRFHGRARVLLDLRDMVGQTVDVAWQEFKLLREDPAGLERIAVVTASQPMQWSSWLAGAFSGVEIQAFEDDTTALGWIR